MLSDSSASSSSFVVVPSVVFPILCSHASRAAPLRRCCLPCGMAFPRRNNKKCPSPPFQETETLKLLPSDSCSPCAKHFLTATNLGLSSIFYRTAPEKSIFFCRTSQFFCRRLRCCICLQQGEFRARERGFTFGGSDLPAFLFDASGGPISSSSGRNGGKNAAKNQWFLEFLSSDCSCGAKRFRSESPLRLPSLPLTWHAESNGRPSVWAIIKSRTCRQRRQVWVRPAGPRPEARNIPFENKSAGRCGRCVRALRPPVRKKERPPKRSFFFGSELSSN